MSEFAPIFLSLVLSLLVSLLLLCLSLRPVHFKLLGQSVLRFLSILLFIFLVESLGAENGLLSIAYCDTFSPPGGLPEEAVNPTEAPPLPQPAPQPPVIPELPHPLISDEARRSLLYSRYLSLNGASENNLERMVSIIYTQAGVERMIEAALVSDGFSPHSILAQYREIRGLLHSPQGELLTERTYRSYLTQIHENGTRGSVPYRRIMRALQTRNLFLDRRE
uniref:Uncharacterized protein n=1 Tax=Aquilaria sinensis TaxID=210372 RepID=A0A7T0KBC9_9ROSI|nr:hypothetical protein J6695_mgp29 [Aquilaria sinensis]YP_010048805.1 hypothetical protein J6695_mgp10 [Aquilaria sinensis]QPK77175.1 hypothetical protein [Aquilaria sinensis]QPK77176.1 hypothetical protein [Aquilaria sinensis]